MPSSGSCSRCNRPLAAAAVGDLCAICCGTGDYAGPTPVPPPPDATVDTPRPPGPVTTVPTPAPGQQSTRSDSDRTRSPMPDGDTDGFTLGGGDYVPHPPPGYDLLRPLGAGGWGAVYLAREHAAERTVAIKFLHSPGSRVAFDRFLVEARVLAALDHPNIVKVITVDAAGQEPFLTMEYATGGTLADLIGRDCPTPAEAARLMAGAADAVAAAHARGVIHRDLKPSNILLAASRSPEADNGADPPAPLTPKVSDFGLAKRLDRDEGLTRTGPIGTACYMSPEAAAGRVREVGAAADVYGLGATLYHLLTGRPPFGGATLAEVLQKVKADPPDRPRSIRPEVPAGLEAVVVKAMEKAPAHRYPTAAAMAADLRRFLAGQVPAAPVLSPRRRAARWLGRNRMRLGLAAAAVLAAAVLVAAGRLWKADPVPPPVDVPSDAAWLAEAKQTLAAGRPVTFIGPTGLPKYHRLLLEPGALGESPLGDGTCAFQAFGDGLLELAPDLGLDRYRVSLELRRLQSKLGGAVANDVLGPYFGYAVGRAQPGADAHALFAVAYDDLGPRAGAVPGATAALKKIGYNRNPKGELVRFSEELPPVLRFVPARGPPAPWRRIEIDVGPDEVHVRWATEDRMVTLTRPSGEQVRGHFENLKAALDARAPGCGPAIPGWGPRRPFGVYSHRSAVAVRNVVVTPLP